MSRPVAQRSASVLNGASATGGPIERSGAIADPYMTADEAADTLGVNLDTLYHYVRRKGIRTLRVPGVKASRYWREDVERVSRRGGARGGQNPALVSQTAITTITAAGPYYRGVSAIALAESHTLEDVAALLWQGEREALFPEAAPLAADSFFELAPRFADLGSVDVASLLFPLLDQRSRDAGEVAIDDYLHASGEMMRWFAAIAAGRWAPTSQPLHLVLAEASCDPPLFAELFRRQLVLGADHHLDAAAYAVRAVANTGASPYRTVLTGLFAAQGCRLQANGLGPAAALDELLADPSAPADRIAARLRAGERLPGFSALGGGREARAEALLTALTERLPDDLELRRLNKAVVAAREIAGLHPSFLLVADLLNRRSRLPRQDHAPLRLARLAGWVAHAVEQMQSSDLFEPRAAYVGVLPFEAPPPCAHRVA